MCEPHSHLAICFWAWVCMCGSCHASGEDPIYHYRWFWKQNRCVEPTWLLDIFIVFQVSAYSNDIYCAFTLNHLLQTFFRTRGRRVRVNAGVGESGAKVVSVWDCGLVWPRMYNNELFWKLLTMTAWLIMEMQFTNFLMMLYTRLSFITDLTANTHLCVLLDVQDWVQKPSSISWKCRKPP